MKKLTVILLILCMLLPGCKKTPDADTPEETGKEAQSAENGTTSTVAVGEASTDPQNAEERTDGTENVGANSSTRPDHGIELPDDNW